MIQEGKRGMEATDIRRRRRGRQGKKRGQNNGKKGEWRGHVGGPTQVSTGVGMTRVDRWTRQGVSVAQDRLEGREESRGR